MPTSFMDAAGLDGSQTAACENGRKMDGPRKPIDIFKLKNNYDTDYKNERGNGTGKHCALTPAYNTYSTANEGISYVSG